MSLAILLAQAERAPAAEVKVWTARALATVLAEVGPQFESTTGHKLSVSVDLPAPFVRRANAGESFDVLITTSAPLEELAKDGKIVARTRTNIARSGIGVEVRAGAPKPDISTVDAFKRTLLEAKSIAYLKNVGSGLHVARLVDRFGIGEAIEARVTRPETDIVSELVARGDVELGIVVLTQILTTPGVELVGPLPPEIQSYITFIAGIGANSKEPAAASDLIQFLTGPIAAPVIEAQGMETLAPLPKVDGLVSRLVGSWRLVSYEDKPAKGPSVFPYGTEPKGFLVYDTAGHMAIQIMKQPHPRVASGDEERVTPQEKEALFDAYIAYFGTYRVDEATGSVIHHVEGDLYDVYIGRDEPRPFELSGDRLVLKPVWSLNGQGWTGLRVFDRVK